MSDPKYGRFEPPVMITDTEWHVLEAIRAERTVTRASSALEMRERQVRFLLANVAQKLRIASAI